MIIPLQEPLLAAPVLVFRGDVVDQRSVAATPPAIRTLLKLSIR